MMNGHRQTIRLEETFFDFVDQDLWLTTLGIHRLVVGLYRPLEILGENLQFKCQFVKGIRLKAFLLAYAPSKAFFVSVFMAS